jgi:hypothetical protein
MLVPSICGLCKLGLSVIVTDGALVAAAATPSSKLNPSKVTRPAVKTLDTTYLRANRVMGKTQGSLTPSDDGLVRYRWKYFLEAKVFKTIYQFGSLV